MNRIVAGTRASLLARAQTGAVAAALRAAWPEVAVEIREISTAGDRDRERPLTEIGGKGLFTEELAAALRAGTIDLAVHSLKDLPIEDEACGEGDPPLCIAAVPGRADARDALISRHGAGLAELPANPRIGTSSARRAAQLLAARPDAEIVALRGNVDTRLRKAETPEYDAIVLAMAGLARLGWAGRATQILPFDVMLPAPGQGALAVQCRSEDAPLRDLMAPIHDRMAWAAATAERAFLRALGGGCAAPVAAYAEMSTHPDDEPRLHLMALVASADGRRVVRIEGRGPAGLPEALGQELARQALEQGAAELLDATS